MSGESKMLARLNCALSIARAITEAHGGTIEAESADGTSITFRVKLRAI